MPRKAAFFKGELYAQLKTEHLSCAILCKYLSSSAVDKEATMAKKQKKRGYAKKSSISRRTFIKNFVAAGATAPLLPKTLAADNGTSYDVV